MDSQPNGWAVQGRFPDSELVTMLDERPRLNLSESTTSDLTFGELVDIAGGIESLRAMPLGYGPSNGLPALRAAIADLCLVEPDEVLTTTGTALGLFLLSFELCRPGDEMVLATPCFSVARDTPAACGAVIRPVPLLFEEGYRLDPARIVAALTDATRLVSIASPHNPSGIPVAEETVVAILDAMRVRAPRAILFVDETFRLAAYEGSVPPPSVAALDPRVVTGSSISKAHGLPGLRVGWLTVRDPLLRRRLTLAKVNLVISGSVLDEALAAAVLSRPEAVLAPRRRMLAEGLALVERWRAGESHRLDWVRPQVGALCCLRFRPEMFDDAAVETLLASLAAHDLQLAPGAWFGESARVVRLGFGYLPLTDLAAALVSLSRAMDQTQRLPRTVR